MLKITLTYHIEHRSQAGVYLEPSPLLTSDHGTGSLNASLLFSKERDEDSTWVRMGSEGYRRRGELGKGTP